MEGFDAAQGVVMNDSARQLVNDVLVWIGFGTVIGLLAKGIMPGRDPGGAIATVLMGVGGTVMGCGVVSHFTEGERIVPVSPHGDARRRRRDAAHSLLLQAARGLLLP